MRNKLRIGGLAAVVSATTLVLPQFAIGAAQAVPVADLSITKTVAVAKTGTIIDQSQFVPALSDTRATGHYEFVGNGLHLWTQGTISTDKVAEYWAASGGIPESASLEWSGSAAQPGTQIIFDTNSDRTDAGSFNVLVGEAVYGDDFWYTGGLTRATSRGITCPSTSGGSGSDCHGTLAQWQASLPSAQVYAYGFSLGSGVLGDGVLAAVSVNGTRYPFGTFSSSIQAAPGETLEYKLAVANASTASAPAGSVVVTDTLPTDLSYVAGTLVDNGNGCAFVAKTLTCNAGTFGPGTSTTIKFKAKLSSTVTSNGLQPTIGHNVDVQKQEVYANLPATNQPETFTVMCPAGYLPTDGGLLIDAVDQGGFYSDIVVSKSAPTPAVSGVKGWTVTATNHGEERAQGKVKVTCLDETIGSSNGHSHSIVVTGSTGSGALPVTTGGTVTRACPTGYTPVAPQHEVTSGIAVIRSSYADGSTWNWTVDYEDSSVATFDVSCLAPTTTSSNGHTASLTLNTESDVISVEPESRTEGVQQCLANAHAITGGYQGASAGLLSLGKEQRGNNYMFRFYNDDWARSWNAGIQVTCVGVRTPDEPQYYHVVNTATVTSPSDPSASSSSADVAVVGDPAVPASGVIVGATGSRTRSGGHTTAVVLTVTCPSACSFTIRVTDGGVVVAKVTKSLTASPSSRSVSVPTTSAGKDLGAGQVSVKVKTADGNSTKTVTLS